MIGLGYSPFQPFWPLFLHHALLAGGGFTVFPHAFVSPWLEVSTAGGVAFGMVDLGSAGVMMRSPGGGGFLIAYGPEFFRIVRARAGTRVAPRLGVGADFQMVQVVHETPVYAGRVVLSGEIPFEGGMFLWALDTDGRESQAWGTFWISEGPARLALDGEWRAGEVLGSLALLLRLHPQVEMGVAWHSSRSIGWLVRVFPRDGLSLTVSAKIHPHLPISTGVGLSLRGSV